MRHARAGPAVTSPSSARTSTPSRWWRRSCELTYYAAVPGLTALLPTNWLMTKHPGIYLRAALMQAAEYIKNDGEFQKQALLLRSLISGMNRSDQMANQAKAGLSFRRRVK